MPAPSNQISSRRPKGFLRLVMIAAALLIAMIIGGFSIWRWRLNREVNAQVAAIRAHGLPVNWHDLSVWPSVVSDSENGAFVYTNAFSHLHLEELTNYFLVMPERSKKLSDTNLLRIKRIVESNREALEIIYSAGNFSKFRYPVDFSAGYFAKLPHLQLLKYCASLLTYDAYLKAEAKDAEGAVRSVEASLHLAKSLENEPELISELVGSAILQISYKSLERVLCRESFSGAALEKLSAELSHADETNRILTGLIGERATASEYMRLAQEDVRQFVTIANHETGSAVINQKSGLLWRYLGFFARDQNFYLAAMQTNLSIINTPPPASFALAKESDEQRLGSSHKYYLLSSLVLPDMSNLVEKDARLHATTRTALAAVAVERWRDQHDGSIPDSLDALVPRYLVSVPIDPYTGEPLKFKKLSKGYVVYSVGPDRKDDGGLPLAPASSRNQRVIQVSYDFPFTVER